MTASTSDIQIFFDNYGVALATGDVTKIVCAWNVPSLVVTDENSIPVSSTKEVEDFFKSVISDYQSNGITSTTPNVKKVDPIAENITGVHVDWSMLTHDGVDRGTEKLYYLIRGNNNHFVIDCCVSVSPNNCNS